jgi:hypothetical protein
MLPDGGVASSEMLPSLIKYCPSHGIELTRSRPISRHTPPRVSVAVTSFVRHPVTKLREAIRPSFRELRRRNSEKTGNNVPPPSHVGFKAANRRSQSARSSYLISVQLNGRSASKMGPGANAVTFRPALRNAEALPVRLRGPSADPWNAGPSNFEPPIRRRLQILADAT